MLNAFTKELKKLAEGEIDMLKKLGGKSKDTGDTKVLKYFEGHELFPRYIEHEFLEKEGVCNLIISFHEGKGIFN